MKMRKARLILIAICASTAFAQGTAFAQTNFYQPQNCHAVDRSSLDNFMKSVGLEGGLMSMVGEIAEDGHMTKLGAAFTFVSLAYDYWKSQSKPPVVCSATAPNGQQIGLLGTPSVMQKQLPSLSRDYQNLTSGSTTAALLQKFTSGSAVAALQSSPQPQPPTVYAPAGRGTVFDPLELRYWGEYFPKRADVRVHGKVTDMFSGGSLANASVLFLLHDSFGVHGQIVLMLTDSAGAFDSDLWAGEYTIYANAAGYCESKTTTILGISSAALKISLRPKLAIFGCSPP
jgi:hypothetical protein